MICIIAQETTVQQDVWVIIYSETLLRSSNLNFASIQNERWISFCHNGSYQTGGESIRARRKYWRLFYSPCIATQCLRPYHLKVFSLVILIWNASWNTSFTAGRWARVCWYLVITSVTIQPSYFVMIYPLKSEWYHEHRSFQRTTDGRFYSSFSSVYIAVVDAVGLSTTNN